MANTENSQILFKALEAALDLAETRKWGSITLIEIASKAGVTLQELYALDGRDAVTDAFERWADQAMLTEDIDMDDTPRERLFEVLMRRFEHMEPRRSGITSLMTARDRMPARRLALLSARRRTARWALISAGLDKTGGAERTLTEIGLVWVLRRSEKAWQSEPDETFTRTMATLDDELAQMEDRLKSLQGLFSRKASGNEHSTEADSTSPEAPQAESHPA